jgi:hypothetical protein
MCRAGKRVIQGTHRLNKRIRCAVLLLSLWSCAAYAEEKAVVAIHGFDKMSCNDWLSSDGVDDVRAQYIAWIRGIVTGYNFANPDNQVALGHMPGDFTLGLFVDSYCRGHRSGSFVGAAFDLIEQKRGDTVMREMVQDPVPTPTVSSSASTPAKAPAPVPAQAPATDDSGPFQIWLKKQSDDMRSLDIDILHNIYKKEMALQSSK